MGLFEEGLSAKVWPRSGAQKVWSRLGSMKAEQAAGLLLSDLLLGTGMQDPIGQRAR